MTANCTTYSFAGVLISKYSANGSDYVMYGDCNGFRYCCAHNEESTAPVDTITWIGTVKSDDMRFTSTNPAGQTNLYPVHANSIMAFIYGGDNSADGPTEVIYGSNYVGNTYGESLYGEGGGDFIDGGEDGDRVYGGGGDDELHGGAGNDQMDGGSGVDEIYGDDGNDTLCDTACGAHYLDAGLGNNSIWYEGSGACSSAPAFLDAGLGMNDRCGNTGYWGGIWATCDVGINVKPTTCP